MGIQLGLSDQHNLKEFLSVCLKIGQHPDLFKEKGFKVLCLIDDECRCSVLQLGFQQEIVELYEVVRL